MVRNRDTRAFNLNNLLAGRTAIEQDYFDSQNYTATTIVSALMLAIDLFWIVAWIFGADISSFRHPAGITGIIFSTATSLAFMLMLLRCREIRGRMIRSVMMGLHVCINITVVLLSLGRNYIILENNALSPYNGIALSTYYVIICAFLPFYSRRDSEICTAFMFLSGLLPVFLLPRGAYVLNGNIIIRLSTVVAYFVFRLMSLRSARLESGLVEASYRDQQTGVLNRRAVSEYMKAFAEDGPGRFGVLAYDIDGFKSYNAGYSNEQGDKVLVQITQAISSVLADNARTFRYNGDEFIVVLEDIPEEDLLKTAVKVKETVAGLGIERTDDPVRNIVTVTVGCSWAPGSGPALREVISEAETQLLIGKKGSKDCVVFKGRIYIDEGEIEMTQQPTLYTERVAQAVNEAMGNNEIKAFFQPLYETATHKLVGAEALSRWIKPDNTVILPSEFIPELEKNSSILALDWYMFDRTCRMLKSQQERNIPQVRVSVNFSRMHALYERSIEKRLCEIADSYGIRHSLIEIEITESAYIHLPTIIEPFIRKIRAEGFAVAVDDFGSGASSLEFIKSVDVDTLKIDKSLVNSNFTDEKERVLLESVILLAHRLRLNSVAEGVETAEQLGLLKTLGCNQIQGFIFAPPLSEQDFLDLCSKEVTDTDENDFIKTHRQSSTINMLMDTVFKKYPVVLMSNLSRNSYFTMTDSRLTSHSYAKTGVLTDLLEDISSTMHPDDVPAFRRIFKLDNQFRTFHAGDEKIVFTARIHGDEEPYVYKTVETMSYFIQETGNEDLLVITFFSEAGIISP